jgi:hypothetical protein
MWFYAVVTITTPSFNIITIYRIWRPKLKIFQNIYLNLRFSVSLADCCCISCNYFLEIKVTFKSSKMYCFFYSIVLSRILLNAVYERIPGWNGMIQLDNTKFIRNVTVVKWCTPSFVFILEIKFESKLQVCLVFYFRIESRRLIGKILSQFYSNASRFPAKNHSL